MKRRQELSDELNGHALEGPGVHDALVTIVENWPEHEMWLRSTPWPL